jgi:hypothetical protein
MKNKKNILGILILALVLFTVSLTTVQAAGQYKKNNTNKSQDSKNNSKATKKEDKKAAKKKVTIKPEAVLNKDSLDFKIIIKNPTKKDVTIESSSGQVFDFEVLDAKKQPLYRWSADKSFIAVLTTTEIKAKDKLELGDSLTGEVFQEIKDKAVYVKAYITGTADFVNQDGYLVKIKK